MRREDLVHRFDQAGQGWSLPTDYLDTALHRLLYPRQAGGLNPIGRKGLALPLL